MATQPPPPSKKERVEQELAEKSEQIERRLTALQDEVLDIGPSIGRAIFDHPLVSVGGMLLAGVVVGLIFGGRRKPSGGVEARRRELVERYIEALARETRARVARGDDAGQAVRKALKDRAPLIVYETPPEDLPRARRSVPRQAADILLKTMLGMGVKMGVDVIAARFGVAGMGDSDAMRSSVSTAAVSEALE